MPYSNVMNGIIKNIFGTKKKNNNAINNNKPERIMAIPMAVFTMFSACALLFPSMTAMSNLALMISIKIYIMEIKIPNSANEVAEIYFGKMREKIKLMTCTNANPENSLAKLEKIKLDSDVAFIHAKLQFIYKHYGFATGAVSFFVSVGFSGVLIMSFNVKYSN